MEIKIELNKTKLKPCLFHWPGGLGSASSTFPGSLLICILVFTSPAWDLYLQLPEDAMSPLQTLTHLLVLAFREGVDRERSERELTLFLPLLKQHSSLVQWFPTFPAREPPQSTLCCLILTVALRCCQTEHILYLLTMHRWLSDTCSSNLWHTLK